jgi:hypothetical protein
VLTELFSHIEGEYVAFCEGDDFWTTPSKLQNQIDVLRSDPSITLCYHSHVEVDQTGVLLPSRPPRRELTVFEQGGFIKGTFGDLTTASVVYRKSLIDSIPDWYFDLPFGDISLFAWASLKGRIAAIPGVHSAYRRHAGGMVGQSHLAPDHAAHLKGKLFWHTHICRLYSHLCDEAHSPELKAICQYRCYGEHMEAAWFARMAGQLSAQFGHLKAAVRADPIAAIRSATYWKQLLLCFFPLLDTKRSQYLADYCVGREKELKNFNDPNKGRCDRVGSDRKLSQ